MSQAVQDVAAQTGQSIARLCRTVGLCRASYYRHVHSLVLRTPEVREAQGELADADLREQIQQIALECCGYGYRRIAKELHRRGVVVNHKRVLRLLREDNLLCLRKKRFVSTTDSGHGLPIYPNLAAQMPLSAPNQLWVADLTYIRLGQEFIYLAVILDAFSRRCVGWALGRRLDAELAACALRMALGERRPQVHHSDQGVQYASGAYTTLLKQAGVSISMSRRGNPYDNAKAESFIKTLKYEQVYLSEYENLADAFVQIGHFLEQVYNQKRLHSALGYLPPAEFEEQCLKSSSSVIARTTDTKTRS
jgi:transposase InsO family protein